MVENESTVQHEPLSEEVPNKSHKEKKHKKEKKEKKNKSHKEHRKEKRHKHTPYPESGEPLADPAAPDPEADKSPAGEGPVQKVEAKEQQRSGSAPESGEIPEPEGQEEIQGALEVEAGAGPAQEIGYAEQEREQLSSKEHMSHKRSKEEKDAEEGRRHKRPRKDPDELQDAPAVDVEEQAGSEMLSKSVAEPPAVLDSQPDAAEAEKPRHSRDAPDDADARKQKSPDRSRDAQPSSRRRESPITARLDDAKKDGRDESRARHASRDARPDDTKRRDDSRARHVSRDARRDSLSRGVHRDHRDDSRHRHSSRHASRDARPSSRRRESPPSSRRRESPGDSRLRRREDERPSSRDMHGRGYERERASDRDRRDRDRRRGDSRDQRGRDEREGDRKRRRSKSPRRKEEEDKEFAAKVIAKLEQSEDDEEKLIEERRRKRQELIAKLQQEKQASAAVSNPTATELASKTDVSSGPSAPSAAVPEPAAPSTAISGSLTSPAGQAQSQTPPMSPAQNGVISHGATISAAPSRVGSTAQFQGAAPASDSDVEDEEGLAEGAEIFQTRREGEAFAQDEEMAVSPTPVAFSEQKRKIENQEKRANLDMFSDEIVDDMFAATPPPGPGGAKPVQRALLDNYDDPEGYYSFQVGEVMNDRYEVFATHGKGVFSTVLRARDTKPTDEQGRPLKLAPGTPVPEVAIKVIRANDVMAKAGQTEKVILRKLAGADPEGKRHIIRMLTSFEYRHHLCLVFEPLDINLRQLTKKYGQGIGLNIAAVRTYAAQMLSALYHMRACGVLHADIKPDNILVSASRTLIKVCDFGSAMFTGDNEITPYLVSRFYRAPEIILGLRYDHPMDIWSVGCVIYELFTGKILFPGKTNNEMLKLMMDVKGPFPKKMLKKGAFANMHFEDDAATSFCLLDIDPLTKRPVRRLIPNPKVQKDFAGLLAGSEGDRRKVAQLADLLERMMNLDPEKRLTAKEALRHDFIKDSMVR